MGSLGKRKVLAELARRNLRDTRLDPAILFGKQKAFALSKAKYKAACCSRRAGKSFALAYVLIEGALKHPGSINPFITLTRNTAKDIIWPPLREVAKSIGLNLSFKANTGDIHFPNGSKIILRGCEDRRQAEKLRGLKFPRVVIDEAQAFPSFLKEILDDIIAPGMMDYEDAQCLVTGTPNRTCTGVFFDICHGTGDMGGWDVHGWTMRENWYFSESFGKIYVEKWLADYRKRKGWGENHATYLREYCGKWVRDKEGTVYEFNEKLNLFYTWESEDQASDWEYVLGVDTGWNDPSAFVLQAASPSLGEMWTLDSYQETEMSNVAVARQINRYMEDYPVTSVIMDTGGYGKSIAEDMRSQYNLPIFAAEKTKKYSYIQQMNSDFRTGAIRVLQPTNEEYIRQLSLLQWDEKSYDTRNPKEDRRTQNHCTDAGLYSWRYIRTTGGIWAENDPEHGTEEWWAKEEERMLERTLDSINETDDDWWENL